MSKWEAMAHSEVLFKSKLLEGFPGGSSGKKHRRHRRPGFDPWVRKIPWRRARQR